MGSSLVQMCLSELSVVSEQEISLAGPRHSFVVKRTANKGRELQRTISCISPLGRAAAAHPMADNYDLHAEKACLPLVRGIRHSL